MFLFGLSEGFVSYEPEGGIFAYCFCSCWILLFIQRESSVMNYKQYLPFYKVEDSLDEQCSLILLQAERYSDVSRMQVDGKAIPPQGAFSENS